MKFSIDMNYGTKILVFGNTYWPIFIALFLTYLGGLWAHDYASSFVLAFGAAGVVIFLPLYKMEKSLWLYLAAFFMCIANDVNPNGAQYVTGLLGIDWLSPLAASIVIVAVQGALITFVLLLLCMIIFKRQVNFHLLVKIPVCMLFCLPRWILHPRCFGYF